MPDDEIRLIATKIHGRILIRAAGAAKRLLIGFHGYKEDAQAQMDRLAGIPGADDWTRVAVQGLHRFYRSRSDDVIASWMTRQDREAMIEDNIAYIDAVVESVGPAPVVVFAGFSQGVAMAFRSAVRGRYGAAGIIAVGGDVPPDLLSDPATAFPRVLLARGERDEWYTQAKFEADVAGLRAHRTDVRPLLVDGGHEWNAEVAAAAGKMLAATLEPLY